ncbi:MAG: outer membrane protein transport protein [Rickettsiales bacterium]|nr:outer membrane protein transport protein [Rickettsiales bacterium]
MKFNKILACSLATLALTASQTFAAGYSSNMYSTSGLSTAYAGSATGMHDSSDSFFNAATLSELEKGELIVSVTYLDLDIDMDNISGSNASGTPQTSQNDVSDAGEDGFVPALYIAKPINDRTTLGLSVTTPFGLATKYDKGWIGSGNALESQIVTHNINPSVSYKVNNKLNIAAGFQAQYYKATLTKDVYNVPAKSHGSDWGYGYNLGLLYKPTKDLKVGLGYRSKIKHKVEGTTNAPGVPTGHVTTAFHLGTTTPESLDVGVSYKISDTTEVAYDMIWTRWSRVKSLVVRNFETLGDDRTVMNWHDSFLHSIGVEHQASEKLTLRAGTAYEKAAIGNANREPRLPVGDRIWTSLGFNYDFGNGLSVDASYVHLFFDDVNLSTQASNNLGNSINSVNANVDTKVNLYSLAIKKEF